MDGSPTYSELLAEAIGAPEPGALNFTALERVLKAILRKLDIENVPVDRTECFSAPEEPAAEQDSETSVESPVGEQFEQSESYQQLLASVVELQDSVQGLGDAVREQKRISASVLPSVEQLEQFQSRRTSTLHPAHESSVDLLSLAARLDTVDDTIGRLTALAHDTVLEHARIQKSLLPYLAGGELANVRAQLDNINQLLKAHFPDYQAHRSSIGTPIQPPRPSQLDEAVPIDFYQHSVPCSVRSFVPRRSTITDTPPRTDLDKELDTIRVVLKGLVGWLPLSEAEPGRDDSPTVEASSQSLGRDDSPTGEASSQSLGHAAAADSIRSIWPKEIEELLQSNHERIDVLERTQEIFELRLEVVKQRCADLHVTFECLMDSLETYRETFTEHARVLRETLVEKLNDLDERCSVEQLETTRRVNELEQQLESCVDFEHFQTRLSKDAFYSVVNELRHQLDARVTQFKDELELVWLHLDEIDTALGGKCEKAELWQVEWRLRTSQNLMLLMVNKLRNVICNSVEAAGTTVRVGPETTHCVSCNHEATMRSLAELIPTGKEVRTVETELKQRIELHVALASRIFSQGNAGRDVTSASQQAKPKSTRKAKMVQPNDLTYKVHPQREEGK